MYSNIRRVVGMVLGLLVFLLNGAVLHAQIEPPLTGPLLALGTAQQDRIIVYDVGTETHRELAFGTRWHYVWDFSPDGCRLLFTLSEGAAPARLYSARLDGSDQRELVQYDELPAERWGIWEPQWSPDGSRIAFTLIRDQSQRDGGIEREYHIAWITPDGGEPTFYSVTGNEHTPRWSPDGEWLAYISYDERVAGADINATAVPTPEVPTNQPTPQVVLLNEADLWLVSADAETKYNLTNFPTGSVSTPRWSPDGELISFIYSPGSGNDTFWMIARSQGAIPTQLSFEWNLTLDTTWLPDSTGLVAAVRDFRDTVQNRLWTIPLVGNADTDATLFLDDLRLTHADYPRFSADGRWLALRSAYELVLVDTLDRTWTLVEAMPLGNTPPVWSPPEFGGEITCNE